MKIIVVGGGPAGIKAALRARELGAGVTLIESKRLGGTAFCEGPAPVRTLARAARLRADSSLFSSFGLEGKAPKVNFEEVIKNANRVGDYANEVRGVTEQVRAKGIEVVDGAGPRSFCRRQDARDRGWTQVHG